MVGVGRVRREETWMNSLQEEVQEKEEQQEDSLANDVGGYDDEDDFVPLSMEEEDEE